MKCVCIESSGYERLNEPYLECQELEDKDSNEKEVRTIRVFNFFQLMFLCNLQEQLDFYNDDGSFQSVVVERNLCTSDLCQLLALKNRVSKSINWCIVEEWTDFGLGKSKIIYLKAMGVAYVSVVSIEWAWHMLVS